MLKALRMHRLYQLCAIAALVAVIPACSKDEVASNEPNIGTMRLIVGTQTVNVSTNGTVTGGPIVIPTGNTAISATFLMPNGQVETKVAAATHRLDVTSDNAATVSFTRVDAFSGTLVGGTKGSTTLRFALFHVLEGHNDLGPFPVSVTVQ